MKSHALTSLVNLRQGTDSTLYFSTGNTLPLVARPFGTHHWTIRTEEDATRFFLPSSRSFRALRLTHQPSPWIGDYGALELIPQCGEKMPGARGRSSCFRPETLELLPHRMTVQLDRYRTKLEFTPTERAGLLRLRFPAGVAKRLIVGLADELHRIDPCRACGVARNHTGDVPANFGLHFSLEFSVPVCGETVQDGVTAFEFPTDCTELTVRIGASFLDAAQAWRNAAQELRDDSFETVANHGRAVWEEALSRLSVSGVTAEDKRTFYSCFYRTLLFPREFHEYAADGSMIHYSPYDGKVYPGPLYADNGFWDTHRTVYPLFSLLFPERYGQILAGWLNAAREGGWFPRWSSPGYRCCMTGTHIDAVVADAAVKGISGFDLNEAYRYLLKDGETPVDGHGLFGRRSLLDYLKLGFVPDDRCEHAAARTMDYAANDFAISQVAGVLGDVERQRRYRQRSASYRNLFNPVTGVLQGRRSDGSFSPDFNPVEWSRTYIEGSSWQCGFAVPHDPLGLIELFGGNDAMIERLNQLLAAPPDFDVGAYNGEIHEMVEMAAADFGQYAQSNQPSHHILWFYTLAGRRDLAAAAVGRVVRELYSPERFPGDEDNGEMAAWYLFAVAGFYPFCPGKAEYVASAPLAAEVRFTLPGDRKLVVRHSADGIARFDGRPVDEKALPHALLAQGGVLEL